MPKQRGGWVSGRVVLLSGELDQEKWLNDVEKYKLNQCFKSVNEINNAW
jgi:hypothetical protein